MYFIFLKFSSGKEQFPEKWYKNYCVSQFFSQAMPWKETVIVTWAPLQSDFHFRLWPLTPSRSLVPRRQSFQNLGLDNRAVGTKEKRSNPWLPPLRKATESSINLKVSSSIIRAPGVLRYYLKYRKNYIIGIPEQPSYSYPKCPAPFCLLKYITFLIT